MAIDENELIHPIMALIQLLVPVLRLFLKAEYVKMSSELSSFKWQWDDCDMTTCGTFSVLET